MSTIITYKEQRTTTAAPLILAEFLFVDGSTLNLSTAPLNTLEGGFQYSGKDYLARIARCQMAAIQERSPDGIQRIPTVNIEIHDSDKAIWPNFEWGGPGFAGAILTLRFIFWQSNTSTFSSDSWTPFIGICSGANIQQRGKAEVLAITAVAFRNMARFFLPEMHCQSLCSNTFPPDAPSRLAAGGDMSSIWYGCGYCPDQTVTDPEFGGSAQRGNLNSGVPFTTCNLTRQDCIARGMFTKDSSNRQTGSFTGVEWAPVDRLTISESYISGKSIPVLSSRNDAVFNQRVPKTYGTQWGAPAIANMIGDANSTRHEAIVCLGYLALGPQGQQPIFQVVLNGVQIPYVSSSPDQKLFRWSWVNQGSRRGSPCLDAGYGGQGDPYGSQATIEVVYYIQLGNSASLPSLQVLKQGPNIKLPSTANPSDQGTWPYQYTTIPTPILLDVLISSGWQYSEIDLQSFIDEYSWCNVSVSYTALDGSTKTHFRYQLQFELNQQRSAAEVIPALLRAFNGQLNLDPQTGLLKLRIRKGLADQQPSPIAGSNYTGGGISSTLAAGGSGTGFPAFVFDETSVTRNGADAVPFIETWTDDLSQTPNELLVTFQDEENSYAYDSLKLSDPEAVARAGGYRGGQEIQEQYNALGFSNFDQVFRVGQSYLSQRNRGHLSNDTRGTRYWSIPLNFRVAHLRVGDICLFSWQYHGISNQLVRVANINWTGMNFETCEVTVAFHNDLWYTDAYGQQSPNLYSNTGGGQGNRPPYPWQPFGEQPVTGDSVFGTVAGYAARSWWSFAASQQYGVAADGGPLAQLQVFGCPPVNQLSQAGTGTLPPLIQPQGTSSTSGGSIPDGIEFFMAVCAVDSAGFLTRLSGVCKVTTQSTGSNANTGTIPNIIWQSGATGYVLYAGTDTQNMAEQSRGSGTPGSLTVTSLNLETFGPPDPLANSIAFRAKEILHGGVFGDKCTGISTNTISFTPPSNFTVNAFAGYDLQLVARALGDTSTIPIADFRVSANDAAGNFTVSPDPTGIANAGDVFIMLFKPGTITDTTISDPNLVNPYAPAGLTPHEAQQISTVLRVFVGPGGQQQIVSVVDNDATSWTLSAPWPSTTPTSASRFIQELAAWEPTLDTEKITSTDPSPSPVPQVAQISILNYGGRTLLLQANVFDANNNGSLEVFAPFRIVYIWGSQGTRTITGAMTQPIDQIVQDGLVLCDSTAGPITYNCLPAADVPNQTVILQKVSSDANSVTINAASGEAFEDGTTSDSLLAQGDSVPIKFHGA